MKILSVDGGATKTVACLYDTEKNKVEGIGISGASNYFSVSHEESQNNITTSMDMAYPEWRNDGNIQAIVGIAGFGDSKKANEIGKSIMDNIFNNKNYILENDGTCAYRLAHIFDDGAIFAPGTGSIGIYQLDGKINRLGGWGWFAGDEGSASWIGKKAITMAEEQYDGIIDGNSLVKLLESYFNNTFVELINGIESNPNKRKIAMIAPYISKLALEDDKIATSIINEAADYDTKILNVLNNKIKKHSLALVGGTTGSNILIKNIKKPENSELTFYHGHDVCVGGIIIAANKNNITIDRSQRDKLVLNIDDLIQKLDYKELNKYLGIIKF